MNIGSSRPWVHLSICSVSNEHCFARKPTNNLSRILASRILTERCLLGNVERPEILAGEFPRPAQRLGFNGVHPAGGGRKPLGYTSGSLHKKDTALKFE